MTRETDERWRTSYRTASFGCMQAIPEPEQGFSAGDRARWHCNITRVTLQSAGG